MNRRRTVVLVGAAMIAFAANSLLTRAALRDTAIDAAAFAAIRVASGAVVLAAIARASGRPAATAGSWISAAALFAYAIFFSLAYRGLTAGTGALVLFACVQATMIGWGLARGERFRPVQVAGLALAAAGLVWLVAPGLDAPPPLATAAMATAGVAWGVYSLRGRGVADAIAATSGNFVKATPFAVAVALVASSAISLDPAGIGWAIASGAAASGLGYAIWYTALPALAATTAAIVQLTVPVIAAVAAVAFLGEAATWRLALASAAILGGIALVVLTRRRPPALVVPTTARGGDPDAPPQSARRSSE